jgi:flotillin
MGSPLGVVIIVIGQLLIWFILAVIVLNRIVKAGPHEILVISGRRRIIQTQDGRRFIVGFRMLKGGRTFVWPFIERVDRLPLNIIPVEIKDPSIYMVDDYQVNVDAVAQIKIKGDDVSIAMAAERFLTKDEAWIGGVASQIIDGYLKSNLSVMTFEDLKRDRNTLVTKVLEQSSEDLGKMGIEVESFIIRDIRKTGATQPTASENAALKQV